MKEAELFTAITNDRPALISGTDFQGLNYGLIYSKGYNDEYRRIVFSGREASYFGEMPERDFPANFELREAEPHARMYEASHVHDELRLQVDLSLRDIIILLEERGILVHRKPSHQS